MNHSAPGLRRDDRTLRAHLAGLVVAASAGWSAVAFAAPEEITVFTDDIQAGGTFGLAVHGSYVPSGPGEPAHEGARPSRRATRLMPELTYGLGHGWESALHFPVSRSGGEGLRTDGVKWRFKYAPERPEGGNNGLFWAGNIELARLSRRLSESANILELKAVGGWRSERWLVSGNLNIGRALGGGAAPHWGLAPSAKIAYSISEQIAVGAERYHDLDRLRAPRSHEHVNYLVADVTFGRLTINAGIGRGNGTEADRWVGKIVIAMPLP